MLLVEVGFLAAVGGGFAVAALRSPVLRWPVFAIPYGTSAALGYLSTAMLWANAGVSHGDDVRLPMWHLAVAVGVGVLAAGVGALMAAADAPGPTKQPSGPVPSLGLGSKESAMWHRAAAPAWVRVIGPVLLAVAVVAAGTGMTSLAFGCLPAGVIVTLLAEVRVSINGDGLSIHPPMLPYPRKHIPIDDIWRASVGPVEPLTDLGGWGYRITGAHRSGLAWQTGQGLWIVLNDGREFVVAVADATTAAGLINDLVAPQARGED